MLKNILRLLMALPAVIFITFGVRWLVMPEDIAPFFGMTLMQGVGLSTQIGDMAALFLMLGLSALSGIVTGKRIWFLAPALFLVLAAIGRMLAWAFHDAALATDFIFQEFLIAGLWFFGSKYVCADEASA